MGPVSVIGRPWVARQVPEHAEPRAVSFIASHFNSLPPGVALAGGSGLRCSGHTTLFTLESALSWFSSATLWYGRAHQNCLIMASPSYPHRCRALVGSTPR